ncbi:MAG: tRNA pseudouridine(38-40) synthase TruA [Deltaproteobacteria bacterium]|nr:tRNA pseudouridine(38-40) synthase TruA [Deltaproteobacteria bacterium]
MRTICLLVEYDGTQFSGWQVQRGASNLSTVQGVIEATLERMIGSRVRVRAASRTDAGVHARGQVVAFENPRETIGLRGFERGLTSLLPPSVVVRHASEVENGFDPRRASRGKRYRYTFWNASTPSALDRDRSWFEPRTLDREAMREGAARLLGTHDFEAFRSAGCQARHAVRTMYQIDVTEGEYSRVYVDVLGNAFVRNMVRIIVGNLRDVGLGAKTPGDLEAILEARDRRQGGMTAPPHGLCLEEVIFDDRLPPRPHDDSDLTLDEEVVVSKA